MANALYLANTEVKSYYVSYFLELCQRKISDKADIF